MAEQSEHFQVIIIGAGPIGLACALEAQKRKVDYLVLDKGCLVNSLYNYPANMTFFSTSERLEIGDVPFVSNTPKPTRNEALEYYRRVAASKQLRVRLFEEVKKARVLHRGRKPSARKPRFAVVTARQKYTCDYIVDRKSTRLNSSH